MTIRMIVRDTSRLVDVSYMWVWEGLGGVTGLGDGQKNLKRRLALY